MQRVVTRRSLYLPERFQKSQIGLYRSLTYIEFFCHNRNDKSSSASPSDKCKQFFPSFVFLTHKHPLKIIYKGNKKSALYKTDFLTNIKFSHKPLHNIAIRGVKNRTPLTNKSRKSLPKV